MQFRATLHDNKSAKLVIVTGSLPSTLLNSLSNLGVNVGTCLVEVLKGKLVEGSSSLNVGESGLKVSKFLLNSLGSFLSVGKSLSLKSLNGLQLLADVVSNRRKALVGSFDLVDNILVLEGRTVVRKVNLGRQNREVKDLLAVIVVSLAESLERGNSRASKAESGNNLGPVDLSSDSTLIKPRLVKKWNVN